MSFAVKDIGSFFIEGEVVELKDMEEYDIVYAANGHSIHVDPNGQYMNGQMYVQYVRLENPKVPYPVLMWHGGGLTGATFERTPDGRPGWQSYFLNAGYHVYLSDAVERGRSSWSMYPEIYGGRPSFRTYHHCWQSFRIGPKWERDGSARPYENSRFPVEYFSDILCQSVPRWGCNNELTQRAYNRYLDLVGPCILMAHSQGGAFALKSAAAHGEAVKAMVLLEPSGIPDLTDEEIRRMKNIPQLILWGDYIQYYEMWQIYQSKVFNYYERAKAMGNRIEWIDIPKDMGITGNSHLLYMESNSDEIAEIIRCWLEKQVEF